MWKYITVFFFPVSLWLTAASPCFAQVVINEVFPAPSTGKEWIELANIGNSPIDVSNWQMWDVLTDPSHLWTFENGESFAPGQRRLIEVSNKLNNSGDGVLLKNVMGMPMSVVNFGSTPTDKSWARFPEGTGDFQLTSAATPGEWNTGSPPAGLLTDSASPLPSPSPTPTPSPNPSPSPSALPSPSPSSSPSPNPSPSPSPTPTVWPHVQLNEVVACPNTSEREWVEIRNLEMSATVLSNWRLRDRQGNLRAVSLTLTPLGYEVVEYTTSNLNNDGETLTLLAPDGSAIETIEMPACERGQSYARFTNDWQLTATITKGGNNQLELPVSPSPSPTPSSSPSSKSIEGRKNSPQPLLGASSPMFSPPTIAKLSLPIYQIPLINPEVLSADPLHPHYDRPLPTSQIVADSPESFSTTPSFSHPAPQSFFPWLSPLLLTGGGSVLLASEHKRLIEWASIVMQQINTVS